VFVARSRADRDRAGRGESVLGAFPDFDPSIQYFLKRAPHSVRMKDRMRDWPIVEYQNASW
jgi:hypothetical protein